jgi:hypothetical protein
MSAAKHTPGTAQSRRIRDRRGERSACRCAPTATYARRSLRCFPMGENDDRIR